MNILDFEIKSMQVISFLFYLHALTFDLSLFPMKKRFNFLKCYFQTVANKELEAVKLRASKRQRGMVDSRSSEYFESILERRKKLEREAEESQKTIDLEWKKQGNVNKMRQNIVYDQGIRSGHHLVFKLVRGL